MNGCFERKGVGGELQGSRIRSLLVLLDLTPVSDRILRRVTQLPLSDHAQVTLLHVLPGDLQRPHARDVERYARQQLAEEAWQLRKWLPDTARVVAVVKTGVVLKEAAALARSTRAELVAMGRGSGRTVRDTFLGSTAERLIRRGKLPVLVIRLPARAPYLRPALALDRDHAAQDVVGVALRVLQPRRPPIPVIHAFTPLYENLPYPSLSEDALEQRRASCQRQASGELAAALAAASTRDEVPAGGAPAWKLLVRHGSPRAVVVKLARGLQADLLVLGTHGRTGIAHMILGTVAGELLREVACDVLVVPPRQRA